MRLLGIALGLAALAASGCTPLGLLNAFVPREGYAVTPNLAFGPDARQAVDVYQPETPGPWPVLVFLYGGRWQSGDRREYRFVGEAFASRGFLVVIPDTPLYPGVKYPAFLQDAAKAVHWAVQNAAAHGGNPDKLFVMGHSSGAYNAAMLALDERWLAGAGTTNAVIDGMVGLAGPYDFAPFEDADIQDLFGPREGWPGTQPIAYADADDPPVLLLQGHDDDVVKPGNATRLAARIQSVGGRAEVKLYDGIEHYKILTAIAPPLRGFAPVVEDASTFLKSL
ncbi:MAG: alpha/beta hydrolase [Candidatus Sericytochromatia bacterium]